jgi:uncharacterized membrane protein
MLFSSTLEEAVGSSGVYEMVHRSGVGMSLFTSMCIPISQSDIYQPAFADKPPVISTKIHTFVSMLSDTKARSLVKGISWRTVGSIDTFVIAYFFFGKVSVALPIAIVEIFTKIFLYFLHERLWNQSSWFRENNPLSNIRSLLKGISWRAFGTLDTIFISWIISGNPLGALKVGTSEVFTKIFLFYLHERIWRLIKWGRIFKSPVAIEVEE